MGSIDPIDDRSATLNLSEALGRRYQYWLGGSVAGLEMSKRRRELATR
jgi:hypothetical protein